MEEMPKVTTGGNKRIEKSSIKRILVRATNWVGDAVMTIPALEAIKENFPDSSITVMARPWVIPLFEHHPAVDDIISFPRGKGILGSLAIKAKMVKLIRKYRFDMAILFQNAFEAAFLSCLGGVRLRIGYITDGRRFFLSHGIIRNKKILAIHQTEYYLFILKAMGWSTKNRYPVLYISPEDIKQARRSLSLCGIKQDDFLVGLGPGAIYGETKRWPSDRFAKIGDLAYKKWGAKVVVMGSEKEIDICSSVTNSMVMESVNFGGRTSLGEAMAIIAECDFFLTNDSGLMHIAAALGVPTVAIFGSTNPATTGPSGPFTMTVKHDIACAPCLQPECKKDFMCMLSIEVQEVWEHMEHLKKSVVKHETCSFS
jgi:heptosyltransferase-2